MRVVSPSQAAEYLRRVMKMEVEEFWVIGCDSDRNVLASECLFRGTVDSCFFHPRDVFRFACRINASSLIVAHNHPSGNSLPSDEDFTITRELILASKILKIPISDHLIVTSREFFSFLEKGFLEELQ